MPQALGSQLKRGLLKSNDLGFESQFLQFLACGPSPSPVCSECKTQSLHLPCRSAEQGAADAVRLVPTDS